MKRRPQSDTSRHLARDNRHSLTDAHAYHVVFAPFVAISSDSPLTVDEWIDQWVMPLLRLAALATRSQTLFASGGRWSERRTHSSRCTASPFGPGQVCGGDVVTVLGSRGLPVERADHFGELDPTVRFTTRRATRERHPPPTARLQATRKARTRAGP